MLPSTPSSTSATSRLIVLGTASGTSAGGELFMMSIISILLEYQRSIRIRTNQANGANRNVRSPWSGAPDLDGSGAPVLSHGRLAGFYHVGDNGVAVLAVLAR